MAKNDGAVADEPWPPDSPGARSAAPDFRTADSTGAGPGAGTSGTGARVAGPGTGGRAAPHAEDPAAPAEPENTGVTADTGDTANLGDAGATGDAACRRRWWLRGSRDFDEEIEHLKGPNGNALIPWLLMLVGPAADIAIGRIALPWLAGTGLAAFCVLYVATVRAAFAARRWSGPLPRRLLTALACVCVALSIGYGGNFVLLFVLVSLCVGSTATSRRHLALTLLPLSASAGTIAGLHHLGFWSTVGMAYGTFMSGLVVSVIITLFHAVQQLKETRQQLARSAVAQERLRFSRDLHDLLGHTLSVIVVKSEAARRLAPRDLDAALCQITDIESVGRQALTEIREAVTGYREGSLSTELDRARSALAASEIDVVVQESGPPLPPQTEALLGWVVREGVTNVVRHSGASRTRIELRTGGGQARLTITDNGCGPAGADCSDLGGFPTDTTGTTGSTGFADAGRRPAVPRSGTGLRGLTERLASAGGSLASGPVQGGGFQVAAVLPVEEDLSVGGDPSVREHPPVLEQLPVLEDISVRRGTSG